MLPTDPAEQTVLAEHVATVILARAGLTAPVDPRELAAALGYSVHVLPRETLGVSGVVHERTILVARAFPPRVRWTIAHELGHVAIDALAPDPDAPAAAVEALANRIAGALLVPRALVGLGAVDLPALAARCGVSLEATANRLLDLLPSALAVTDRARPSRARVSHLAPEAPAELALEVAETALARARHVESLAGPWRVAAWPTPAATRAVALATEC